MDIMNNVKLTLATTLSALALTFAGAASADNGKRFDNQKQKNQVSYNKKVSKQNVQKPNQNIKKVFAKNAAAKSTASRKVIVTKTIAKKPAKPQVISKNRYNTKKVVKTNSNKKVVKRNIKKVAKPHAYTVRPGDTLYRISLRTGISVNKIAKLNRITNWSINNIRGGQVLRIS